MPAVKRDEGKAGGGEVEERGKGNEEKGEATCDVSFVAVGREGRSEAGKRGFFHTHTPLLPHFRTCRTPFCHTRVRGFVHTLPPPPSSETAPYLPGSSLKKSTMLSTVRPA